MDICDTYYAILYRIILDHDIRPGDESRLNQLAICLDFDRMGFHGRTMHEDNIEGIRAHARQLRQERRG